MKQWASQQPAVLTHEHLGVQSCSYWKTFYLQSWMMTKKDIEIQPGFKLGLLSSSQMLLPTESLEFWHWSRGSDRSIPSHKGCYHNFSRKLQGLNQLWNHWAAALLVFRLSPCTMRLDKFLPLCKQINSCPTSGYSKSYQTSSLSCGTGCSRARLVPS